MTNPCKHALCMLYQQMQVRQPNLVPGLENAVAATSQHGHKQIVETQIQKADTEALAAWKGSKVESFANALCKG